MKEHRRIRQSDRWANILHELVLSRIPVGVSERICRDLNVKKNSQRKTSLACLLCNADHHVFFWT